MGKKKEIQNQHDKKSIGSENTSTEPELPFNEINELLLTQIHFLDDKIKYYFWVNFVLLILIAILSAVLIIIGIILAFQYGPANLKVFFSIAAILIGFVFLVSVMRTNPLGKIIQMIKRISQMKVILVGFMKQIAYIEQARNTKDNEEVSQRISFSKEIVQQTVDDLDNPFD